MSYQAVQMFSNVSVGVKFGTKKELKAEYEKEADASSDTTDVVLVKKAQAGDLQAFRVLHDRYERRIYAAAYALSGNRADAEDIVQESFLKAYKRLDTFKGQSSFYTWLYRIVFNYSIDHSRKRYRKREKPMGDALVSEGGTAKSEELESASGVFPLFAKASHPEESMFQIEMRGKIQEAIGSLSPAHRAVIVMREIEGLSYDEISDTMKCSKGTVMSRLFHARQKLQTLLKPLLRIADGSEEALNKAGQEKENLS